MGQILRVISEQEQIKLAVITAPDIVEEARKSMDITFVKVKAHAGNKYNELADKLAKKALEE